MKLLSPAPARAPVKFKIPTKDNLVPIRLDIEIDGQRFKDAFTWNPVDPDSESEVVVFAKRTVKDLKHPPEFITQIVQSIQGYGYPRPECWACCCICNKGTTLRDIRSVNLARESCLSKKGHRGSDYYPAMKRKDWDVFEPIVDILSSEEVGALEAREERDAR